MHGVKRIVVVIFLAGNSLIGRATEPGTTFEEGFSSRFAASNQITDWGVLTNYSEKEESTAKKGAESEPAKPSDKKDSKPSSDKTLSEEDVQKIIKNYLKEQEEKKSEADKVKAAEAKAAGYQMGSDLAMTAAWNNGLEISTKNKDFRVHVGGRYQMDTGYFSVDRSVENNPLTGAANINTPYADGVDFRRACFRIDGTMYEVIDWAAEMDFVNSFTARNANNTGVTENSTVALTDFWWQVREVPLFGSVRVGQQKEPIGFEHLVSSRFLPFMERSFNQDTFYGGTFNGFNPGISSFRNWGQDDTGSIQYGIYKPVSNVFGYNVGDGDYSLTMRITKLLWYVDEGRGLLHVGLSGRQASAVSTAGAVGDQQVFRTRDAIRTGLSQNWSVPAGVTLYGEDMQWVNGELVAVYDRWTFQSEYLVSNMNDASVSPTGAPMGDAVYHGGYVQMLCFLTGEHDNYDKSRSTFDRVKPIENFFVARSARGATLSGSGAWQVGARYNFLDLNDSGLNGGILHNFTGGLNWFLNPNMKAQLNYIATYRDVSDVTNFSTGSGWINGFGGRIACDF